MICKKNGEPFAPATKSEIKKGIRKFYVDYVESYRAELGVEEDFEGEDYINFSITAEKNFTDPDRLPTPYTVKSQIESASRVRDQAYIMLLWSTGGRHGEVPCLKW